MKLAGARSLRWNATGSGSLGFGEADGQHQGAKVGAIGLLNEHGRRSNPLPSPAPLRQAPQSLSRAKQTTLHESASESDSDSPPDVLANRTRAAKACKEYIVCRHCKSSWVWVYQINKGHVTHCLCGH